MDIGIGIPNSIPGTTGAQLLEWARRAEAAGFSSLASIGAVSFPSYEELTVFAAAGAVTERIRLVTNVLIAPARSAAELAKQAATVDQVSGGRLTLGLAPGWRAQDYTLTGRDYRSRGARFDEMLGDLRRAWAGEALAEDTRPPAPPCVRDGGVPLLIGGMAEATPRRVAEHGVGWTAGGAPPEMLREMIPKLHEAWEAAGREGPPHLLALAYFALGDTEERSRAYLLDYYGFAGDAARGIADSVPRSADAIRATVETFAELGFDELVLDPTVSDVEQVQLLADVVL